MIPLFSWVNKWLMILVIRHLYGGFCKWDNPWKIMEKNGNIWEHTYGKLWENITVSVNGGTPKWMVYNGNSKDKMDDEMGYPYFI